MTNPKITRRQIIKGAAAVGAFGALGLPSAAFADAGHDDEEGKRMRWDMINVVPPDITAGGIDIASAEGGSTLTLTGSGTFRPGHPRQVTGGGTWRSTNPVVPGSGTYRVTELVSFVQAPGTLVGSGLTDHIGPIADGRAGLAALRIKYSDGLGGILFLSCNLDGTPDSVNEGTNGSRGMINFFMPKMDSFTEFHVLHEAED